MSATQDYEQLSLQSNRTIDLGDGDTYANREIETNGYDFEINCYGSGWEVRNVGIIGEGEGNEVSIRPQVPNDPVGEGLVENVYIENITNNFNFVNRHHEGHITYRGCSFINNLNRPEHKEDGLYGSSPGNPGEPVKPIGWGGTIDVIDCYAEDIGGYGFRFGSDGSRCINTTVVGTSGGGVNKAFVNLFAGGFDGYNGNHADEQPGVLFRNCDVGGNVTTSLQVSPHQDDKQAVMTYGAIVTIEDCRFDTQRPVRAFTTQGGGDPPNYPVINGTEHPPNDGGYGDNEAYVYADDIDGVSDTPDLSPPDAAPSSAREAARGGSARSIVRVSLAGSGTGTGGS